MKFEILTPLEFTVRTSEEYWQRLIAKHPDIEELEDLVQSVWPYQMKFVAVAEIQKYCYFIGCVEKNGG
jgi:hypothetical protein